MRVVVESYLILVTVKCLDSLLVFEEHETCKSACSNLHISNYDTGIHALFGVMFLQKSYVLSE